MDERLRLHEAAGEPERQLLLRRTADLDRDRDARAWHRAASTSWFVIEVPGVTVYL